MEGWRSSGASGAEGRRANQAQAQWWQRRSGSPGASGGAFLHSSARSVIVATTFLRTALLLARANETGVVEWVTWFSFQENPTTVRVSEEEVGLSMAEG